jgi:enoyl-CoA hydratase/carnithine racemase
MMQPLERHESIAVIRLDADDNRFTAAMLDAWDAALDAVEGDPSITALVSIGEGRFYSNGLDVELLTGGPDVAGPYLDRVLELLHRVLVLPVATVAAVNGHAFGAGAMLAIVHDARVMRTDRGFLCLPEVDLGLPFLPLMGALITTKWAPHVAQEAMTTGRRYRGGEAAENAMVDLAIAEPEVFDTAMQLARSRGGKDRGALRTIKTDLYRAVTAHRPGL